MSTGSEKLLLHDIPTDADPEEDAVFAKLNKPSMEEDLSIEGSCRGLVLMRANNDRRSFFLYKPTTGELVKLPKSRPLPDHHIELFYGIGYDTAREDYKLVVGTGSNKSMPAVDVFSLKSYSWKRASELDRRYVLAAEGVYSDGFVHWLDTEGPEDAIVSFNVATETFVEGLLPSPSFTIGRGYTRLAATGGGLLIAYRTGATAFEVSVWKDNGSGSAWTDLCRFSSELFREDYYLWITTCLSPLMKEDGKIVISVRWGEQGISVYDPDDDSLKTFELPVPRSCTKSMTTYLETA